MLRRHTGLVVSAAVAAVVLAAASTLALAAASGAFRGPGTAPDGRCLSPPLAGRAVNIDLVDSGGPMMRAMGAWPMGGMMRILTSTTTVRIGTVSLRVANTSSLVHELVVLPLPAGQGVGQRAVGAHGRIDETGSLGEASRSCGAGAGGGINPGSLGWVTLQLAPGRYELVCDEPGHYAGGMFTELDAR